MALLPVATNRTSTTLTNQRLLFQLNNDQLAIQRHYDQLSTGRRVLRLSDDPAAAGRALGYQREISNGEQVVRNASSVEAFYQSADVALDRVDSSLIEARGIAVEASQSVLSDDQKYALSLAIRQTMESVVAAGNAVFNDHQILGGVLENGIALEHINGTVRFNGTDAVGQTKVGTGGNSQFTVAGADAIGVSSIFEVGESLGAALNDDTRLVDMRQGAGVRPGVISLSDGDDVVELDLTSAATIGDVVELLRTVELDGRALGVRLEADSIVIQYADSLPGTLAIKDLAGSELAKDLRISNPLGTRVPPLIGDRLEPSVTLGTHIEDLGSGAGLDLSSGIVIDRGPDRYEVDLSNAETIGDVLIAINRSGADVRADLDRTRGRIEVRGLVSGVDYSIGENGGTAATQLGIRTATEDTLLNDLSRGRGLVLDPEQPDLVIRRPDGIELSLDLTDAGTIADVMSLIQDHPDNQDTRRVRVQLNSIGNGLEITAPPGAEPIRITQPGLSDAGTQLGLIPAGENEGLSEDIGGEAILLGADYQPRDAGGAVDTLLRLERAVADGDIAEIGRLQQRLDDDLDASSRARGRVGVWSRNLADLKSAVQEENTLLTSRLSDELDADLATVVSELNSRQAALEASMRFVGQTARLSVLDFL